MINSIKNIYTIKNFKNEMKLEDPFTLWGLLRRANRKYPKCFNFVKRLSITSTSLAILLLIIPGTSFPFQYSIKLNLFKFIKQVSKFWYLNGYINSPVDYLISINEILLIQMNNQIYDEKEIIQNFLQTKATVQVYPKLISKKNRLDLLAYSEIILRNIIQFDKKILKSREIWMQYWWVYEEVVGKLLNESIKRNETQVVQLLFPVIQYLINFSRTADEKLKIFLILNEIIEQRVYNTKLSEDQFKMSFAYLFMMQALQQKNFKECLKYCYKSETNEEIRSKILKIFQGLQILYIKQSTENVIK